MQLMRTDQPVPVRLENYRPPDWLVETVALDVSLDRTATRVRVTLALKPNPKAAAAATAGARRRWPHPRLAQARRHGAAGRGLCGHAREASPSRRSRRGRSGWKSRP